MSSFGIIDIPTSVDIILENNKIQERVKLKNWKCRKWSRSPGGRT